MGAFVLWFTGLPGAGKTTIATAVATELELRGERVERLDGDVIRTLFSDDLGFDKESRDTNVARIASAAARIARAGAVVIVSAIAPYEDARRRAREVISKQTAFVEVHVATPLEECIRRDPKGHYAKALDGRLANFTGVSDPYEIPSAPELRVQTTDATPTESAAVVLARIEELGLIEAVSV
jgi:adenylyl-sulfate kinase